MTCSTDKKDCQSNSCTGCEFVKQGLCDYPFSLGMAEANQLGQRSLSLGEEGKNETNNTS